MITTVTTTTTTAITAATSTAATTATTASVNIIASLAVIGTTVLILLLISKELISSHNIDKKLFLSDILNIAIFPLLMMFVLIVVTKITSIL